MSGQNYQPQQPMYQPQPPYQPQPQKGLETHFIAKEKIGLFLMLCAAMVVVGFLLLDLINSGLVDDSIDVILFLGMLAVDAGMIALITLLLVSGVCRDDLPEKVRTWLIFVAGLLMVFFIIVYIERSMLGGIFSGYY